MFINTLVSNDYMVGAESQDLWLNRSAWLSTVPWWTWGWSWKPWNTI